MLSPSQQKLIIDLSKNLDIFSNYKHVAVLTKQKTPVCFGFNDTKLTHPLAQKFGYRYNSVHSEFNAIVKYICSKYKVKSKEIFTNDNLKIDECTLYNIRVDKSGNLKNAKPCPICQKLIKKVGIKDVFYSIENGWEKLEL